MTHKERKAKEKKFVNALMSPEGVTFVKNGKPYNSNDTAKAMFGYSGKPVAYASLFAAYRKLGLYTPEICVHNPSPSEATGNYVLPADVFLKEESDQLSKIDFLPDFVSKCNEMNSAKGVNLISVVGGANKEDEIRFCLMINTLPALCDIAGGHIFAAVSVSGGSKEQNQNVLNVIIERLDKKLEEVVLDSPLIL